MTHTAIMRCRTLSRVIQASRKGTRIIVLLALLTFFFGASGRGASEAQAARFGLFVGPAGFGSGDANPITFASPAEYEFQFASDGGLEIRAALIGLTLGYRMRADWGGYASVGGGVLIDANGFGAGPAAALGYDFFCMVLCGSAEYVQMLGVGSRGLMSPYALRLGVSLWL